MSNQDLANWGRACRIVDPEKRFLDASDWSQLVKAFRTLGGDLMPWTEIPICPTPLAASNTTNQEDR